MSLITKFIAIHERLLRSEQMTLPSSFETFDMQNFRPAEPHAKRTNMPPGAYCLMADTRGAFFRKHKLTTDDLIHSTDPREVGLRKEVQTFFKSAHLYEKHGFTHRRGVLLHGPAGSGKSCLLRSFCQEHIANGGFVFIVDHTDDPSFVHTMLGILQEREHDAKVIVVIEEVEEYVKRRGEHGLLAMLDGERSLEGALVVATTNYPEQLNKRVMNRPRRFDRVLWIGMPQADVRREYFQKKLRIDTEELDLWVQVSEGFSFAAMADLVISNKCLLIPLEDAAKSIKAMMDAAPSSDWTKDEVLTPSPTLDPDDLLTADEQDTAEIKQEAAQAYEKTLHPFVADIIQRHESAGTVANHDN
jgi:SpoVK/Ycf46/Vps4 family AAA+-type ATPase